jgi:DNA-binding IclR family transcriptional regulator
VAEKAVASEKTGGTQLLDRAISILSYLGECGTSGARGSQLAEACDLNISTVHRILSSLEQHGYIQRDPRSKNFRLGLALFALGAKAADSTGFRKLAHPSLLRIAAETGDMVFLMARDGFNTICVDRQESSYAINTLTGRIGGEIPLGVGPASQVILAFMPAEEAELIVQTNAPHYDRFNGLKAEEVLSKLPEIRNDGYALDHGHLVEGISALAVPIHLGTEGIAGSLSINMTSARLKEGRVEVLLALLQREAAKIGMAINPHDVLVAKFQPNQFG